MNVLYTHVMMQFVCLQLANVNFCEAVAQLPYCLPWPCHLGLFWWVQLRLPLFSLSTCLLLSGQDWPAEHLLLCCCCSSFHQSPPLCAVSSISLLEFANMRLARLQHVVFSGIGNLTGHSYSHMLATKCSFPSGAVALQDYNTYLHCC